MIKTSKIREADIRYFDMQHNGLEITPPLGKVILIEGDEYHNPFDLAGYSDMQVYRRVPNALMPYGTEDYLGTMVELIANESIDGKALLLNDKDFTRIFGKDSISIDELEDYIIRSSDFYPDRRGIVAGRCEEGHLSPRKLRNYMQIMVRDTKEAMKTETFFAMRASQKVKKK